MQSLRSELLQERLRNHRLGSEVRARLSAKNLKKLGQLKKRTGRSYQDVFRFLFYLYRSRPEKFLPLRINGRRTVIQFRLPKGIAAFFKDEAWLRNRYPAHLYNDLIEGLFKCLSEKDVSEIFRGRLDQLMLVLKEAQCLEPKTRRKIRVLLPKPWESLL